MKIECTKDQKEKLIYIIADRLDCDRILADGSKTKADVCSKFHNCTECVEKMITWDIHDANDEDNKVTNSIHEKDASAGYMKDGLLLQRLTFEKLKLFVGKKVLRYMPTCNIWEITSIDSLLTVFTYSNGTEYIVRDYNGSELNYLDWLWFPLPDIYKEGEK